MGKRLIHQRRGRGTPAHRVASHRFKDKIRYRSYDALEKEGSIKGKVIDIVHDPARTAPIAEVKFENGEKKFILAPESIQIDDEIECGISAPIKFGNTLPLANIPEGTLVHNLELKPGKGGQLIRSAGVAAQILGKEDKYVLIRLASGEVRKILGVCRATIGTVGNEDHGLVSLGKAGRNRWKGVRPTVRGSVMNPNDHPHGGGEGRTSGGRHPVTPWGKPTKGAKTRSNKKTDRFIMRSRHDNKK